MKMRLSVSLAIIAGMFSCNDYGEPSAVQGPANYIDTLEHLVVDGVVLRLRGFQDTYGLDDTTYGVLSAVNFGSSQPLYLHTYNWPPYGWFVSQVENVRQRYYWPTIISPAEWRDTLHIGDTLSFVLTWAIATFYPDSLPWDQLKAFSGVYKLRVGLGGNPLLQNLALTKYIRVTEEGDPLSTVFSRQRGSDSVSVDFVVRNRISRQLEFPLDDPAPLKMYFIDNGDTLLALAYSLPFSVLHLPRHSDIIVFRFRAAKSDPLFDGVRGRGGYLWSVLRLRERDLIPRRILVSIP